MTDEITRQRLKNISPNNAGKVVGKDIYWNVPFFEGFLELCDATGFEYPAEGLKLACHAPALSKLIKIGRQDGYADAKEERTFHVRGHVVFASLCFRTGDLTETQAQYDRVVAVLEVGVIDPLHEADYLLRFANYQKSLLPPGAEGPFESINRVLSILDQHPDHETMANAISTRGRFHWRAGQPSAAADDWAQAIGVGIQSTTPKATRIVTSCLGNLARVLVENRLHLTDLDRALALIRQASARVRRGRINAVKAKLMWIEATLLRRLSQLYGTLDFLGTAKNLFIKARNSFLTLGMQEEFVLVSLELSLTYMLLKDYGALQELTASTEQAWPQEKVDPLLRYALNLWQENAGPHALEKSLAAAISQKVES